MTRLVVAVTAVLVGLVTLTVAAYVMAGAPGAAAVIGVTLIAVGLTIDVDQWTGRGDDRA